MSVPTSRRLVALCLLLVCVLTACSGGETSDQPSASDRVTTVAEPSESSQAIADGATVIDVRTPEEFAQGHVAGALNIDVEASGFETSVKRLDPDKSYVVYCESGRRAGLAIEQMQELGFDDLLNGGGFEDLAEAGVETDGG